MCWIVESNVVWWKSFGPVLMGGIIKWNSFLFGYVSGNFQQVFRTKFRKHALLEFFVDLVGALLLPVENVQYLWLELPFLHFIDAYLFGFVVLKSPNKNGN